MKTSPLRCGVIGVGGIGTSHAAFLSAMPETRLVAVADIDPEKAASVARERGCAAFSDGGQLLEQSDIEAVIIATPHPLHAEMTLAAAERGIHVLSEKPLAASVAAADSMIEACRSHGVLLGTVFQQRTEASRRAMQQMIARGDLGELHRVSLAVTLYRPQSYYDSALWRGTWCGEGGGILMQAAHALDQLAWLGGMPSRVQALTLTRLHKIETENTAIAILDYGGGKAGWFYISTADTLGGERIEISGDKGALVWENDQLRHFQVPKSMSEHLESAPWMFESMGGQWRDVETAAAVPNDPQSYREIVRAFAGAVRSGDASLMLATGEDGLRSLELANAIALAGQCGDAVELPLDRERYERLLQRLCGESVSEGCCSESS